MRFSKLSDSKRQTHIMENTPLHYAAKSGDLDKARKLLQSGKYDVNMKTSGYAHTALHVACTYGNLDIVRMLISEPPVDRTQVTRTSIDRTQVSSEHPQDYHHIILFFLQDFLSEVY